jgi:SAM-dependent methyltransferase
VLAEYSQRYRTLWERHWWWRSREAYLLDRISRLRREAAGPLRILDVGCGDGLFFPALESFGHVEGIEPDRSLVSDPRWRRRIHGGRLEDRTGRCEAYDLLLLLDVLEHMSDDCGALRQGRGLLKPGGRVLITVPALRWLWSRHDEVNEHRRRYHPGTLRELLVAADFEVESIRFFFFWTVAPLLVRRWLHPAGGDGMMSRRVAADYAVSVPPAPINRALTWLSRGEQALGRFVRWPIGGSLLAIARAGRAEAETKRDRVRGR